jgi:hypothetical protein
MQDEGITLIQLDDRPTWEAATLGALPAQTWGHAAGLAVEGMVPQLAVVRAGGAEMILPFHEREFRGAVDIATLPGLSGLLIRPDSAAPLAAWSTYARSRGWVAGYLQLSPLNDLLTVPPPDRLRSHNALYVFDLSRWDIATSVGTNMRRTLKTGERLGVRLVTDLERLARTFPALHAETRARSGEAPAFTTATLRRWFDAAGALAFGAELDGQIVAAQLGRQSGGWADLHLAGAVEAGRPLQAWLIWQALEHLRAQGVAHVNIGGYGQAGDGLHQMKARLGATEHPLRAVLQVYDPVTLARLCAERGVDPEADYFPPYRASALSA